MSSTPERDVEREYARRIDRVIDFLRGTIDRPVRNKDVAAAAPMR